MRLFVAIDLPAAMRGKLAALTGGLPGARWLPPASYHLTLRFVGEVPPDQAEEIDLALAAIRGRRFALTLAGVGVFERNGRPSAIWAGAERNPALELLRGKVETALDRAGFPRERRRFTPHVTLARLDMAPEAKLAGWVQAHNLFRAGPAEIDRISLFSSRPGKDVPAYTLEVDYALD